MFGPIEIAPSILSADFMNMSTSIKAIEEAGAGYVHVDVMDGHFVPNLTMGVPLVKQLKKSTDLPLDVHLMISNPLVQIPWFLAAGADIVTFHIETCENLDEACECIALIRKAGAKAAVSVKPQTPVSAIAELIPLLDMVLVMSVEPGFSGQSYIEGSEEKVAEVACIAKAAGVNCLIEVDGGIGEKTAPLVSAQGADVLVCGNAVYAAPDIAQALQAVKNAAQKAQKSTSEA